MIQNIFHSRMRRMATASAAALLMPLMLINFVESNPIPVKAAMAAMGLLEETYRLPMVSPRPESRARIQAVLSDLRLLSAASGRVSA